MANVVDAAVANDLAAVVRALDDGASADSEDLGGNTLLCIATHANDTELANLLLSRKADVNLAKLDGDTPLLVACNSGSIDVAKQLLATPRIDVNKTNPMGLAPLQVASMNGHAEILELILQQQSLNSEIAKSTLWWAQDERIVLMLREHVARQTTARQAGVPGAQLRGAAKKGDVATLLELLNARAPIDSQDRGGSTALFIACSAGQAAAVDLLISHRANANLASDSGWSPLLVACINSQADVVSRLLASPGIDVNQPSKTGGKPLPVAAMGGVAPVVELLLAHPDVDRGALHQGKSSLEWAQEHGDVDTVRLLQAASNYGVDDIRLD
eukprot:TRINITY_DN48365_c0_g1_i1.p1 TRINITY_DN48365_c0_g1~~TRINITY_DN48365_c0_g1_i1.p1  ORF type:complete len:329 (+),score=67.71 TRINITY_DN48365_c0_g1_i1:102-1088(+)